jgi:hypothetical protein
MKKEIIRMGHNYLEIQWVRHVPSPLRSPSCPHHHIKPFPGLVK